MSYFLHVYLTTAHTSVSRQITISKQATQPANQVFIHSGAVWCIFLPFFSFTGPLWQYSTLWVSCLVWLCGICRRCNLISSLGQSLIRSRQNFLHNPDNVWLYPLWHAWEGAWTRADLQSGRAPAPLTCRSLPLRSEPDCKSVKALTADSSISGLQRRKCSRKSRNEWQLNLLPTDPCQNMILARL